MSVIHLTTFIAAPTEVVFDLSRHIDVHKRSMAEFKEEAVAGTRFGLIEKDETVTWKSKHFFKTRFLRVKITEMKKPDYFTDEQLTGNFKMMKHEHHFKPCDNGTIMIDLFSYEVPYGLFGKLFDRFYLSKYITGLLQKRNQTIREYGESEKWKRLLIK
jgi:ligand-binding SRPBCC domain-containing protein